MGNAEKNPRKVDLPANPELGDETRAIDSIETSVPGSKTAFHVSKVHSWPFLDQPIRKGDLGSLGDDYRILKKIGSGGMGTVFLAEDTKLLRNVAIKVIHQSGDEGNTESQQRFLREARAMAAIESEHVVTVYHVGHHEGIVFLVMPVLRGETLGSRLNREKTLTQEEAIRIAKEIATGLNHAHKLSQIHRDIKPENVWLEAPNAKVKILDFGLVRTEADTFKTVAGAVIGTPQYMSPEQVKGKSATATSDLFSLGAVLYQMLSGQPPFEGSSIHATLLAVSNCEFQSLTERELDIEPELARFVDELLSKNPQSRPKSAESVVSRLADLSDLTTPSTPNQTVLTTPGNQPQTQSGSGWKQFSKVLVGSAFLGFLVLLSILVLKFRSQDGVVIVELEGEVEIQQIEIDGNKVSFDRSGNHVEFKVDPGSHRLTLRTPSGDVLQTNLTQEKLTVYSGKNNDKIRAWFEPSEKVKLGSASEPIPTNLEQMSPQERELNGLKWILKHEGAFAKVSFEDGSSKEIRSIGDIPEKPFQIYKVALINCDFNNEELQNLSGLNKIDSMSCYGSSLNDTGLAALTDHGKKPTRKLRQFLAQGCDISEKGFDYLSASPLDYVHIHNTKILKPSALVGKSVSTFGANVGLLQKIKDECPEVLSSVHSLSIYERQDFLELGTPQITPAMASWFPAEDQHLSFCYTRPVGPEENRKTWRELSKISPTYVSFGFFQGGVGNLATDLQELRIESLEYLQFTHVANFSGPITELLVHVPNIKKLDFHYSHLSRDAFKGIENIRNQSKLEEVHFSEVSKGFDRPAAQELADALPKCRVFWDKELLKLKSATSGVTNHSDTAESTPQQRQLNAMKWLLDQGGFARVTLKDGSAPLIKLTADIPSKPFQITTISLNDCDFENKELSIFQGMEGIASIHAWWSSLNDVGLAAITNSGKAPLPKLADVNLIGAPVSEVGLNYLSGSPLAAMNISFTKCHKVGDFLKPSQITWLAANVELFKDITTNGPEVLAKAKYLGIYEKTNMENFKRLEVGLLRKIPDLARLTLGTQDLPESEIFDHLSQRAMLRQLGISWNGSTSINQFFEGRFPNLEVLSSHSGFKFADGEIEKLLANMPSLTTLSFGNGIVSSDAFGKSKDSIKLEDLNLGVAGGGLTREDAQEIANLNPNCKVSWDRELLKPDTGNSAKKSVDAQQD